MNHWLPPISPDHYSELIQDLLKAEPGEKMQTLINANAHLLTLDLNKALLKLNEDLIEQPDMQNKIVTVHRQVKAGICHNVYQDWNNITDILEVKAKIYELLPFLTHESLTPLWEKAPAEKRKLVALEAVKELFRLEDSGVMVSLCNYAAYFLGDPKLLEETLLRTEKLSEYGGYAYAAWGSLFFDKRISMEAACACYTKTLEVFTKKEFPEQWAVAHLNLAKIYELRKDLNKATNTEKAISYNKAALKVFTHAKHPVDRADTLIRLAGLYTERNKSSKIKNSEKAIRFFKMALKEYSRQKNPAKWAEIKYGLGLAYQDSFQKDLVSNFERSIRAFKCTLKVFKPKEFPLQAAWAQHYLGYSYLYRLKGRKPSNIEDAIDLFKKSLVVRTKETYPYEWAETQKNLGIAYHERVKGDRDENMKNSILCLEAALTIYDPVNDTYHWRQCQVHLGSALREQPTATPEDIEKSITRIDAGLEKYNRKRSAVDWAWAMQNLAFSYMQRDKGDVYENDEKAIACFEASLQALNYKKYSRESLLTRVNLGRAYLSRGKGDIGQNAEKAISILEPVLEKIDRKKFSGDWALGQTYLGQAYCYRIADDKATNQEKAITAMMLALKEYKRIKRSDNCGWTSFFIGFAFTQRITGNIRDNIEIAIKHYYSSLATRDKKTDLFNVANIQNGLGNAYAKRVKGNPAKNLEKSIREYKASLKIFKPDIYSIDCLRVSRQLGLLFYENKKWEDAISTLELGHVAIEELRQQTSTSLSKELLSAEFSDLYSLLVTNCLHAGNYEKAFHYTCAAKGRSLAEKLNTQKPSLRKLLANDPLLANAWSEIEELGFQIEKMQHKARIQDQPNQGNAKSASRYYKQIIRLNKLLKKKKEDLAYRFPSIASSTALTAITTADAKKLASRLQSIVIEYYSHKEGWTVFVITASELHCVQLPDFTGEIIKQSAEWIGTFESSGSFASGSIRQQRISRKIYHALIEPIRQFLPTKSSLLIALHGMINHIPIGLAQSADGGFLFEEYELSFVASANHAWALYQQREKQDIVSKKDNKVLIISHSGDARHSLKYTQQEADAVKKMFPYYRELKEDSASPASVITATEQDNYAALHFSCHAKFYSEQPEHSSLQLNGSLTVEKILNELRLGSGPIVALSACQTGRSQVNAGEELSGLNTAFLEAGASVVISSLWPVNDASTMHLFRLFYEERNNKKISESQALRIAMTTLRNMPHYDKTFFWGGFQVFGLPQKK